MSDQPFVSVVIPVYNDARRLQDCLASLAAQTYPRNHYEILVVDNGSQEDIRSVAARSPVSRYLNESKPGPAAARNRGIRAARGPMIAFTDADCQAAPDWLQKAVAAWQATPGCGLVGGRVETMFRHPARPNAVEIFNRDYFRQRTLVETRHYAATANVLTSLDVIERAGAFNEAFEFPACEDREWGRRVHSFGFQVVYADDAVVLHPARRTLRELYHKLTVLTVGTDLLNTMSETTEESAAAPTGWRIMIDGLRPPVRSARQRLRGVPGWGLKLRLYLVILFAYYVRLWVLIRLRAGWRPSRKR